MTLLKILTRTRKRVISSDIRPAIIWANVIMMLMMMMMTIMMMLTIMMMVILVASVRGWRLNHVFTRTPPFASEMSGWLMMTMMMMMMSGMMITDYDKSDDDYDHDEGVYFHPFLHKWVCSFLMTLMIPIMMAILSSLRLNKILYQMQDTGCLHLPGCAIMFLTVCVCVSVKRLSGWWVGG